MYTHLVLGYDHSNRPVLATGGADWFSREMRLPVSRPIPTPNGPTALHALRGLARSRSMYGALQAFHRELGDVFQITLPRFKPVMLIGPEANRLVLVSARDAFRWRPNDDPVARLLRRGVLVTDGDEHDHLRRAMMPSLHKQQVIAYAPGMVAETDRILATWPGDDTPLDMLDEMRRVALLILMEALYRVDFMPDMARLWPSIMTILTFISPGLWVLWPGVPRPGSDRAREAIDTYLYGIIAQRRAQLDDFTNSQDLLTVLVRDTDLDDDRIRDQLLTMLIAGHDTSTALLAWTLYLLGAHPDAMQRVQDEVDRVVGDATPAADHLDDLVYLGWVLDEALRLYPPIHLGMRMTADDVPFDDYVIPAQTRVMYSTFLTHRHPDHWDNPDAFDPERFSPARKGTIAHYTYLPFGGGPRNCIGMPFAQVESKLVLARIFQRWRLALVPRPVHIHMGATLEPRMGRGTGVLMTARPRSDHA